MLHDVLSGDLVPDALQALRTAFTSAWQGIVSKRTKGKGCMRHVTTLYESPLGTLTLASDGLCLTGLWMEGQKYFATSLPAPCAEKDDLPVFTVAKQWLTAYFSQQRPSLSDLPLAPDGSEFRKMVWEKLLEIPYGTFTTYGAIGEKVAERMGKKSMSGQAVGNAVGHNPIAIVIPCHRVIGANGSLTGYAGGIEKKVALLELEGVDTSQFLLPHKLAL